MKYNQNLKKVKNHWSLLSSEFNKKGLSFKGLEPILKAVGKLLGLHENADRNRIFFKKFSFSETPYR
jgi:hypothetical protein